MSSVSHDSLLNKVGCTLQQVLEACELDWSKKGLLPADAAAIAALLPGCVNLRSIKCVHGFEHRTRLGSISHLKPLTVCPWQLELQPALRCQSIRRGHVHHRGHHRALRGPQAE